MKLQNQWLELKQNGGCYQIEAINVSIQKENVIFLVVIRN